MTSKELSQLYYLNREIESDKRRLAELEAAATSVTSKITGLPHAGGKSDKTALAADIAVLKDIVKNKIERSLLEYKRLLNYIDSIDDSLIRQIMTFRHVNGLSWNRVADSIGGGNTGDTVRIKHNRFLKKN